MFCLVKPFRVWGVCKYFPFVDTPGREGGRVGGWEGGRVGGVSPATPLWRTECKAHIPLETEFALPTKRK